jgi:hypothetical protein
VSAPRLAGFRLRALAWLLERRWLGALVARQAARSLVHRRVLERDAAPLWAPPTDGSIG